MKRVLPIMMMFLAPARAVWAQPPGHIPKPEYKTQQTNLANKGSTLGIGFSVGAGEYPILALPVMESGIERVDGSVDADDVRVNRGSSFALNLQWQASQTLYPIHIAGTWSRIATAPGVGLPTPASYSRLGLDLGTNITVWSEMLEVTPSIEARRSMYQNVDSGHFVDAILLKTKVTHSLSRSWNCDFSYGYAPWTTFGLLQTTAAAGSGSLQGSETTLMEIGIATRYKASNRTEFLAAVTQENAHVQLDNADGYLNYGLPVAMDPKLNTHKTYSLGVRQLTLGTVTRF